MERSTVQSCLAAPVFPFATLVIAKLDRLTRAHFLLGLEKAGVEFVAADIPHANRLTMGTMAMVADEERRMISQQTKAALAAAKKHGVKLGGDRGAPLSRAARKAAAFRIRGRSTLSDESPKCCTRNGTFFTCD
jgi:DNA invertase Pin-like site-specific DNA recombinase